MEYPVSLLPGDLGNSKVKGADPPLPKSAIRRADEPNGREPRVPRGKLSFISEKCLLNLDGVKRSLSWKGTLSRRQGGRGDSVWREQTRVVSSCERPETVWSVAEGVKVPSIREVRSPA